MDLLKAATDWARAEVFSSQFFILFGLAFLAACIGFWHLGKSEAARAFIVPMLVAGALLTSIGFGIFFANKARIASFPNDHDSDVAAFVESEIVRTKKTMNEYGTIVFKIIPGIIAICALLIVLVDKPLWRAVGITTIAMMVVILMVDTNANARVEAYHKELLSAENTLTRQE